MFAHLHSHTEYSIADACNRIDDYIKRVKQLGQTACAITDHGVMYGVIDFYKKAREQGIKPIIGCEVYIAPTSRFEGAVKEYLDGSEKPKNTRYYHLILLAKNMTGYENLIYLCSYGYKEGFNYRPRIDKELLEEHSKGLICLSACIGGEIPMLIRQSRIQEAKEVALWYQDIFKDDFYLEVQDHGLDEELLVNKVLKEISKETNIPLVATNDVHYTLKEDVLTHDILIGNARKQNFLETGEHAYGTNEFYVKSEEEMKELFDDDIVERTQEIADKCNLTFTFHETKMPKFDVPSGYTVRSYLEKICEEGLSKFRFEDLKRAKKQLRYEIDVIENMGYLEYFLIVWDFINWSRKNGVSVGLGRGSAAGSVVSYCMDITDVNPFDYNLIFERFLNPDRKTMPDIDIDFAMENRYKTIEYVKEKYGEDNVVQIVTFGQLKAKQSIKDTARNLGVSFALANLICSWIPKDAKNLKKAIEESPQLSKAYEERSDIKQILDYAMLIEGLPRQTGVHAAGVVICDKPVHEYMPLAFNADKTGYVTQYTMTTVEELGFLKMDFLGLRTLTAIDYALYDIERNYNKKINLKEIDYADENVFRMIRTGKTTGIFQLESEGMQKCMKDSIKPTCIDDLIAGIALFRPGPMDFIPTYAKNKQNPKEITYICDKLEPILKSTYGVIVYQEQVMQIVRDLAGYSMGRSDSVRKMMSKKKEEELKKEREVFLNGLIEFQMDNKGNFVIDKNGDKIVKNKIDGCIKRGISKEIANQIFDDMIDFAKYAFNKSHAAAYAILAYQTAYLKYYYPNEYMSALMTSVIDNNDKKKVYLNETKRLGITLFSPRLDKAKDRFYPTKSGIYYALGGVSDISRDKAKMIEKLPTGETPAFIIKWLFGNRFSLAQIQSLAKAGAFDYLGVSRSGVYEYAAYHSEHKKKKNYNIAQMTLFDGEEEKMTPLGKKEWILSKKIEQEEDALGLCLSGSLIDEYAFLKNTMRTAHSGNFLSKKGYQIIVGTVVTKKEIITKKGQAMAFLDLKDDFGTFSVTVFPNLYDNVATCFSKNRALIIRGKADKDRGCVIADEIYPITDIPCDVYIEGSDLTKDEKRAIKEARKEGKKGAGHGGLFFYDAKMKKSYPIERSGLYAKTTILTDLEKVFGESKIHITVNPRFKKNHRNLFMKG
ncbi:DNA polymerase III subunit alpha [Eubacterium oxidoreducens]|uniref:DNA polymerase III subunit alpha n=1 Tax=Eubacterium oxidoreducens TaxID=1732 RepID=A0A1G6C3L0_EUBOX|nr:DNA polymerase III subunit alpha [Eubacterium oxidoreducens]SDB27455.1 DNA polymerase-3 subunit alpha [Eubacterium oxidoreducens]